MAGQPAMKKRGGTNRPAIEQMQHVNPAAIDAAAAIREA
jgi:hypothetical protein